jgi:hypothetical protein
MRRSVSNSGVASVRASGVTAHMRCLWQLGCTCMHRNTQMLLICMSSLPSTRTHIPIHMHDPSHAQKLLVWFKSSFFTWCDRPACGFCGSAAVQAVTGSEPTPDERVHGARRTEVYACTVCQQRVRFPR